jgi:hypothetical protein
MSKGKLHVCHKTPLPRFTGSSVLGSQFFSSMSFKSNLDQADHLPSFPSHSVSQRISSAEDSLRNNRHFHVKATPPQWVLCPKPIVILAPLSSHFLVSAVSGNTNISPLSSALVWMLNVPKGPCVKGLVPGMVLLGGARIFKKWGPVRSPLGTGNMLLKGTVGSCLPWQLLFFFVSRP